VEEFRLNRQMAYPRCQQLLNLNRPTPRPQQDWGTNEHSETQIYPSTHQSRMGGDWAQ
jgi:hypothetical protein